MISVDPISAVRRAADSLGSASALARLCEVSHTAVNKWLAGEHKFPAEKVLLVERETGVSRHDLRPDIYPREAAQDLAPAR